MKLNITGAYDDENAVKIKKKVESDASKFYSEQLETFKEAQVVFIVKDGERDRKIVYLVVVVSSYSKNLDEMTTIANSQLGVVEEASVKCMSAIHHFLAQNSMQSMPPNFGKNMYIYSLTQILLSSLINFELSTRIFHVQTNTTMIKHGMVHHIS